MSSAVVSRLHIGRDQPIAYEKQRETDDDA
jgi:hypothetical protein